MAARRLPLFLAAALALAGGGSARAESESPESGAASGRGDPASPAAATAQAPAPSATRDEAADKRRDTIKYGIDSEIMDLLKALGSERDERFNPELLALLEGSRSPKLRVAVLDFFATLEWKGAEKTSLDFVEERDREDPSLVAKAVSYLAAIKSSAALRFAEALVKEDDKKLLPSVIRLMGRSGGPKEEELLLGWFEGDSFTEALRQEAIKALGDIGSKRAAERLAALAADQDKDRTSRLLACEALGKIKDPASIPALISAANGAEPNVRVAAIEALPAFADKKADAALVEALRDSFAKARISALKGVGNRNLSAALDFVRYKASSDPEAAVKMEAMRTLGKFGGEGFAFLRERMGEAKESNSIRVLCFGLLARRDPTGSGKALEERLAAESATKDRVLYTALAKEVANASDAPGVGRLAALLLADRDPLIRIAGVEWIRKNKATAFRGDLERLSGEDAADLVRKAVKTALESLR